jgi:Domain of unknown function (DUF1735)
MKNILKITFVAFIVFGLASCLKDKDYDNDVVGLNLANAPKVIELAFASSTSKEQTIGLNFVDASVDAALVTVRLAAAEPASEDITVLLDTTGTGALVQSKGDSSFNRLPSLYTLPSTGLSVTIPKGKREGELIVKTNASKFNPSAVYGINFKLKSVTQSGYVLSGNFNTFYTKLGAKNDYDGVYTCEFTNYHPTANPGYIGGTTTVHLVTTGPNSNKIFWPLADEFANPALLNGALNYFGSQEPEYTFNSVTNVVTVLNAFGAPTPPPTQYTMNPSFNSRYDVANRIVYAKFGYSYVGGTFALGTSREWTQKLTYVGPR